MLCDEPSGPSISPCKRSNDGTTKWVKGKLRLVALIFVFLITFVAPKSHAGLLLQWHSLPGCPQEADVQKQLSAVVSYIPDKSGNWSVKGTVTRVDNRRYRLTLVVNDGSSRRTRSITSNACSAFAGAAAVTLALLLGGDISAQAAESNSREFGSESATSSALSENSREGGLLKRGRGVKEPQKKVDQLERQKEKDLNEDKKPSFNSSGEVLEKPNIEVQPQAPLPKNEPVENLASTVSVPPTTTHIQKRWGLAIKLPIMVLDTGPLPHPSFGFGLGIGLRLYDWMIMLTTVFFGTQKERSLEDSSGAYGVDFKRVSGHMAICRSWRFHQIELAPCVGVGIEYVGARSFGPHVTSKMQSMLWPSPGIGAFGNWYFMESMAFFVGIQGHYELSQPRIVIEGLGQVAQLKQATVSAVTGLEWIF